MKIGIIGAGHIGGTLTRRLTALGHDVRIANSRGPETLRELADETGATAVTAAEAPQDAELVIVTIPLKHVPDLPEDLLREAAPQVVVVDTNNYYPQQRDGRIAELEGEGQLTEAQWVAQQLGHTVIKAFNNIHSEHLLRSGRPAGDPERFALPIAGDDEGAKAVVVQLVEDLGFDPVDAGGLADSWRFQPGTPAYGADLPREELVRTLAETTPGRPAEFRG